MAKTVRAEWFNTLITVLHACNSTAETYDELMLMSDIARLINSKKVYVKKQKGTENGRVCKER